MSESIHERLIVANWKMNTSLADATLLATAVKHLASEVSHTQIVICPPFPWLVPVAEIVQNHRINRLFLGAQNLYWQADGAYTGEVSASMLAKLVDYVIVGHSERRHFFQETDQVVNRKVKAALKAGIKPIICIGEIRRPAVSALENPDELTEHHLAPVMTQLDQALIGINKDQAMKLVIAYEPVWAISSHVGTTAASGFYANYVTRKIRKRLAYHFADEGLAVPILYGGSVNPENAKEFLAQTDINGLLVGGASLKVESFSRICQGQ